MVTNRIQRRLLLIAAACLLAGAIGGAAGSPANSLRGAMEDAVRALLGDLFVERREGTVVAVQGTNDFIVRFSGAAPPADAEYLLLRPPASDRDEFPRVVGAARIAETKGETARAVALWSEGMPRPGDRVVWPPRITIVLLPTDAGDSPDLVSRARQMDHWLELELLADRRIRVLGADNLAQVRWRLQRLKEDREYALVVAPLMVAGTDLVELVLRVRSIFTEQTLAERRGVWKTAVAQPASPPSPAAPAPSAAAPRPAAPYGPGIRPVQPQPAIKRVEPSPDRMTVELPHPLKAIALGDVDGDGRLEVVGITDRQAIAYRWTGEGVTPLVVDDPLHDTFTTYVHVDAADLNASRKAQIVLTAVRSMPRGNRVENQVISAIAEVQQGRLEYLARGREYYLRVLHAPGKPPRLLAQAMGNYEPFDGPVQLVEWKDRRYRLGERFPLSRVAASIYGFASGDLDGDGQAELAVVTPDGLLRVYDEQGQRRWESEEDLGEVDARGFAQTPRFPDYRGRTFDATAEQLAVWRAIPRRILVNPVPGTAPDIITVANTRLLGLQVPLFKREDRAAKGGAFGYGWNAATRQFAKRWESAGLTGQALDFAAGDLGGDGRIKLVLLSGLGERRFLDVFTLYDRSHAAGDAREGR